MNYTPSQRPALDRLAESLGNRANISRKQGFTSQADDYDQQLAALNELRDAVQDVLAKPAGRGGRRLGIVDCAALSNALNRVS